MRIISKSLSDEVPQWAQILMNKYPNASVLQSINDPLPDSKSNTLILQDNLDLKFYAQFQTRNNVIHILETFPHISFSKFKKFRAMDEIEEMLKYIEDNNIHKEIENIEQHDNSINDTPLLEDTTYPIAFQLGTLLHATIKESSQPAQFWQILEKLLDTIVIKAISNDPLVFPSHIDEDQRAEMYDKLFGELAHLVAITVNNNKTNRITALLNNAIERFNNGRLGINPTDDKDNLSGKGYLQVTWKECPIKQFPLNTNGIKSKMDEFMNALFVKQ